MRDLPGERLDIKVEVLNNDGNSGANGGGQGDELHPLVKAAITILDGKVI